MVKQGWLARGGQWSGQRRVEHASSRTEAIEDGQTSSLVCSADAGRIHDEGGKWSLARKRDTGRLGALLYVCTDDMAVDESPQRPAGVLARHCKLCVGTPHRLFLGQRIDKALEGQPWSDDVKRRGEGNG